MGIAIIVALNINIITLITGTNNMHDTFWIFRINTDLTPRGDKDPFITAITRYPLSIKG